MDGPVGQQLADKLPDKGLINLAYYDLGFRNLTNSKRPVRKLEDLQGMSIRVIQSPIYIDAFTAPFRCHGRSDGFFRGRLRA